ncbi:MAG: protein-glutamate O-methyltransferase CheR [Solibacillus sp.]
MEKLLLTQLSQLVYDYCGLNYMNNLSSLEMKMTKRLNELNMHSLWSYIRYVEQHPEEWGCLVEILTINETYFYREDKQLHVYQQVILPELMKQNSDKTLKVWSAGCSTGEEPYSLAIMSMPVLSQMNALQITATDINKKVLRIAKNGTYNKRSLSFRRIPEKWLHDYFVETETAYTVADPIKNMVEFSQLNLLDIEQRDSKEQFDVVFCRNVLIYFDEQTIKKVVTSFYNALKKGGYLFLGHAETISKLNIGFKTINDYGTFYYKKE